MTSIVCPNRAAAAAAASTPAAASSVPVMRRKLCVVMPDRSAFFCEPRDGFAHRLGSQRAWYQRHRTAATLVVPAQGGRAARSCNHPRSQTPRGPRRPFGCPPWTWVGLVLPALGRNGLRRCGEHDEFAHLGGRRGPLLGLVVSLPQNPWLTVSRPVGGILSGSRRSLGGHPSERSTWGILPLRRRASSPCPTLDLAPGGVYRAGGVAPVAGALLPHPFTLTCADPGARHRRFPFCGTVLRVAPTGR